MLYFKLVIGIAILTTSIWLFRRNWKSSGFMHAILRVDTILGVAAGSYLTITSVVFLLP
jgi:hypothetical protein